MFYRTNGFRYLASLIVLLAFVQACRAQTVSAPTPLTFSATSAPSLLVTIYQYYDRPSSEQVSIDQFKNNSDKFEARNPPEAGPLFVLLQKGDRSLIAPAPPVDAEYMIERSNPAASYAVSHRGVICASGDAYQLSKDEFKSFQSLIGKIEQSADSVDGMLLWSTSDNGIPKHLDKAIMVEFSVDVRGRPSHPRVVKSGGDKRLDDAACDAVLSQRFKPSLLNGVPQATRYMHIFVVDDQSH